MLASITCALISTTVVAMRNCCAVKRVMAPAPSPNWTAQPPLDLPLQAWLGSHSRLASMRCT